MKVLFFTHEKSFGGASRALLSLIDELQKKADIEIYAVAPFKKTKIVLELKKRNIKVINCFYGWSQYPTNLNKSTIFLYKFIYYFINKISFLYLYKKIKNLHVDIIHSNTSVIDIGAKVAMKLGTPHVWHFREFTGVHLKYIKSKQKVYSFIEKTQSNIIYISKAIGNSYNTSIKKCNKILIYDGISNNFIINKEYFLPEKVVFLQVATLEENKGQLVAVKAVKQLIRNGYNDFELLLVGGDPTGYGAVLNKYIKDNNLEKNVRILGFVSDMNELRKNVNVELMCSPNEAFGLVTIESMMAGNPVIGSNSGATPELILDNEVGYLYELNNSKDLANKMGKYIENKNSIEIFGKKAKKHAVKNFNITVHANHIYKLYNDILRTKK